MGRPNILFVFSDQQHWAAAGFEAQRFCTPNLDRLAAKSVVFENAFCTTPQCSPSRSSILTGLYPSKTGVIGNVGAAGGDPLRTPTLAPALKAQGYRTAYFGKWHLGKDPVATAGWDEEFGVTGPETTDDDEVTRRAVATLEQAAGRGRPFALFLSYNNPHDVYEFSAAQALNVQADRLKPLLCGNGNRREASSTLPESWSAQDFENVPSVQLQFMTDDQGKIIYGQAAAAWQRYRELYAAKVALYDTQLGRVLDSLERHRLTEQTVIVVTSDHGDMDGHHRLIYKGPFMYEQMVRVPLLVRLPGHAGQATARHSPCLTINVDLVPTLLDLAGCPARETDGISLRSALSGGEDDLGRDTIIAQYYSKQRWVNPIRMLRTRRYKYNLYQMHGEELYDLEIDPCELRNLACSPAHQSIKTRLREQLEQWMCDNGDPFALLAPTDRQGRALTAAPRTDRKH